MSNGTMATEAWTAMEAGTNKPDFFVEDMIGIVYYYWVRAENACILIKKEKPRTGFGILPETLLELHEASIPCRKKHRFEILERFHVSLEPA